MKWNILAYIILFLVASCSSPTSESDNTEKTEEKDVFVPIEQLVIRHIENALQIPATEEYSYEIFTEELNGDDSVDYVITVNRLAYAIDEAIKDDKIAKRAEMGYLGMYNYVFYMDGASKKISGSIPVGSSPHTPLKVTFDNIYSEHHKDFMVDFRIRNSCFRRFFTVISDIPHQTFETLIYDGLGTDQGEAYDIRFEPGTYSLSNDIVVYKAELEHLTFDDPMEIYRAEPKINPTEEIDRRWYFHEGQRKYFTKKDEDNN